MVDVKTLGYWSINGVPSCRAPEARGCNGLDLQCACDLEQYEKMSAILLDYFPDAKVAHHPGDRCPINDKEGDDYRDYMDALEERTRAKFEVEDGYPD